MILDEGEIFLICSVASIPLIPGMLISMITMSGCNSLDCWMASSPVPHSATTWNRGSEFKMKLHVSRISVWSSAIRMVILDINSVMYLGKRKLLLLAEKPSGMGVSNRTRTTISKIDLLDFFSEQIRHIDRPIP